MAEKYVKKEVVNFGGVTVEVAVKVKEKGDLVFADVLQEVKVGELLWNYKSYTGPNHMARFTIFQIGLDRGLGKLNMESKSNFQRKLSNVLRAYKGVELLKIDDDKDPEPTNPTPAPKQQKSNAMASALDIIEFGYEEEKGATEEVVPATAPVEVQPVKKIPSIQIWTDGSSLGNPGKGGWAAVFIMGDKALPIYGSAPSATNNQMEAMALVEALEWLDRPSNIKVYLDSEYVEKIASGTNNAKKNADLWQRYFAAAQKHNIVLHHVDGHSGIRLNEFCDQLAKRAAEDQLKKPDRSMSSKLRRNVDELCIKAKTQTQQIAEDVPAILRDDDDRYYADDGYPDEDNYFEEE